jgi:small-conductance mechanosensitive channel
VIAFILRPQLGALLLSAACLVTAPADGADTAHNAASASPLGVGFALDQREDTAPLNAKVPVVVDGRELFRIGASGTYTAAERAMLVNERLADELCLSMPATLAIVARDDMPTIRLNEQHLLSIDAADVVPGVEPDEQAQMWLQSIKTALDRSREERAPGYVPRALAWSTAVLGAALLAHWLLRLARRRAALWLARWRGGHGRRPGTPPPGTLLAQFVLFTLQAAVWVMAALNVSEQFPRVRQTRYWGLRSAEHTLSAPILTVDGHSYSVLDALWVATMIAALWLSVGVLTRVARSRLRHVAGVHAAVIEPVSVLLQYGLTFIGLIVILQVGGLDLSSLTFLASVLGVGIGFGLQNIANNFVSGVIISFERPIQVGDFVRVGHLLGTVERIGARSTEIQTADRVSIIVPNSRFLEHEVINWSHGDPLSRLRIPIGVAYGSDIARVRAALLEAAVGHQDLVAEPHPEVEFSGFGDSALNFELEVWTRNPREQKRIKSALNYRIEANLRRYGIVVPFPQRTLHIAPAQVETPLDAARSGHPERHNNAAIMNGIAATVVSHNDPPVASLTPHLAALDLDRLIAQMRGPDGLDVRDRRHHLKVYPACFVGSEAVEWLQRRHRIHREEAVRVGQTLIEHGMVRHVLDEHPFRDGNFFYRFVADDPDRGPSSVISAQAGTQS